MWSLIISILAFVIIMFIMNLIDKNKEKLIEKFKIEKIQVMKCPRCFNEYDNLDLHFCKHCDTSLNKETRYVFPEELRKKIVKSLIVILLLGILLTFIVVALIRGVEQIIYYVQLNNCYNLVKENNAQEFKDTVNEYKEKYIDFKYEAIKKIYTVIDENIENIKQGNANNLLEFLENVKQDFDNEHIDNNYKNINIYIETIQCLNEDDYINAYIKLSKAKQENTTNVYKECQNKISEIQDKSIQQALQTANEFINDNDYKSAQNTLFDFKDIGNAEITDLYNSVSKHIEIDEALAKAREYMNQNNYSSVMSTLSNLLNENNAEINELYNNAKTEKERIEAERKAQEEAEEKARIEKEKFDYEVYCYFNLIAWNEKDTITDDIAYSKCAKKFGITKAQAKESYDNVENIGYSYQSKYPDIFEKYASQYK